MYTLYGIIDGVEVKFAFYPPNIFEAIIPRRFNGVYIVELHCYDEAGNEGVYTNQLVEIDFRLMKIKQLPLQYKDKVGRYDYDSKVLSNIYGYQILPLFYSDSESASGFSNAVLSSGYDFKILPLEFTSKEVLI